MDLDLKAIRGTAQRCEERPQARPVPPDMIVALLDRLEAAERALAAVPSVLIVTTSGGGGGGSADAGKIVTVTSAPMTTEKPFLPEWRAEHATALALATAS